MVQLNHDIAQRVVKRIATGLARPLSVTDAHGQVLANTSQATIGKYLPCAVEAIASGQLCREVAGNETVLCVPLVYSGDTVGAIALHSVPSDERNYQEIASIAQTLAELIIYQAMVIERLPHQRWTHDKFIFDLLHSDHGSPEVMLQQAPLFNIDLRVPRIVVLVNIEPLVARVLGSIINDAPVSRRAQVEQLHEQLFEQAQRITRSDVADVYSFIDDHRLIMLAAVDPAAVDVRHKQVTQRMQQLLDGFRLSFGTVVSAGVGRYYSGWQELGKSFKDAQFAWETGVALYGKGRVFCVADLGLAAMLWSNDESTKVAIAKRLLHPLHSDHELQTTLVAFLDANLSPSQTAHALHIHRHTLAYRLDKISHLVGLDPRHFNDAVQFKAALILDKLHDAKPE